MLNNIQLKPFVKGYFQKVEKYSENLDSRLGGAYYPLFPYMVLGFHKSLLKFKKFSTNHSRRKITVQTKMKNFVWRKSHGGVKKIQSFETAWFMDDPLPFSIKVIDYRVLVCGKYLVEKNN